MSNDTPAPGHNSVDEEARSALVGVVRKLEVLDAQMRGLNSARADVFREAKNTGLDPSVIRVTLSRRRMDPEALANRDAAVLAYEAALRDLPPPDADGIEDATHTRAVRSAQRASPPARRGE